MKKHDPQPAVTKAPVGNLCVIREETLSAWDVIICPGVVGERTALGRFSTKSEAEQFAREQLEKMNAQGDTRYILHVDACPCWQREL